MHVLEATVQHYAWGGYSFIPSLLGKTGKARRPHAELWMGAHPKSPSLLKFGSKRVPLNELAPDLPFLFKVLDAREMLSIQAHPTRAQARRGYAEEDAAGIPLDAPDRNYKDRNHKPEVHVALTPFWMLHGFRPWEEIEGFLRTVPEFRQLRAPSLKALVRKVLTMDEPERVLGPLLERLRHESPTDCNHPDYWVLRATKVFPRLSRDPGLFFLYFLNLVKLNPGEGTYQPAGVLHAYLEGANVELMANSDNVLRAGLTSKYVDTAELLRTISFSAGYPPVLRGEAVSSTEQVFRTPSEEFELRLLRIPAGTRLARAAAGPAILLTMEGEAQVDVADGSALPVRRGTALYACDEAYAINAGAAPVTFFEASVPRS